MILALLATLSLQHAELPPVPLAGQAETVRRYDTGARQGVAVGSTDIWAVSNSTIVRFDKATGERRAEWSGDPALYPHVNSCTLIAADLVCASSNYPAAPHVSTIEVFAPGTLTHHRSIALPSGIGSATWVERRSDGWYVMFANYDARGSEAPRTHRDTVLIRFDDQWRPHERWTLPGSILSRLAPMSISGGGWGPDGRLYLSGHDLPELYVVDRPAGGGVLRHIETFGIEAEGQAIDWDESEPGMLYGITRRTREVLAMRIPLD